MKSQTRVLGSQNSQIYPFNLSASFFLGSFAIGDNCIRIGYTSSEGLLPHRVGGFEGNVIKVILRIDRRIYPQGRTQLQPIYGIFTIKAYRCSCPLFQRWIDGRRWRRSNVLAVSMQHCDKGYSAQEWRLLRTVANIAIFATSAKSKEMETLDHHRYETPQPQSPSL